MADVSHTVEYQLGLVHGEMVGVKSELGGIKAELAALRGDMKTLLGRESERTGSAKTSRQNEQRGSSRSLMQATLAAGGVSGIVTLAVTFVASRLHWPGP